MASVPFLGTSSLLSEDVLQNKTWPQLNFWSSWFAFSNGDDKQFSKCTTENKQTKHIFPPARKGQLVRQIPRSSGVLQPCTQPRHLFTVWSPPKLLNSLQGFPVSSAKLPIEVSTSNVWSFPSSTAQPRRRGSSFSYKTKLLANETSPTMTVTPPSRQLASLGLGLQKENPRHIPNSLKPHIFWRIKTGDEFWQLSPEKHTEHKRCHNQNRQSAKTQMHNTE